VELGTNHATAAAVSEASTRHEVAEGKASEDQESAFIVKLIQALDERDWSLVTTYTIDGATDYFGHRRASNAFIRKDIEGDARTYRWSKSHPDLSTFHRSVSGNAVYESIEEGTESLEYAGRHHHAHCLFEISYRDGDPPGIYSLSLKVLR
jgi:hypothetical protein